MLLAVIALVCVSELWEGPYLLPCLASLGVMITRVYKNYTGSTWVGLLVTMHRQGLEANVATLAGYQGQSHSYYLRHHACIGTLLSSPFNYTTALS